jgi:protoheme IX farnesyltransferase
MSTAAQPFAAGNSQARSLVSHLQIYAELIKLRVTSLVVATAWCGYFMGSMKSGIPSFGIHLFNTLLGIAVVSGGAAALNQVIERESDSLMRRTAGRPLPSGRISTPNATLFGLVAVLFGSLYLAITTNILTGYLAFVTAGAYLLLYTPLKPVTSFCTFVGAFPGAMPALLGWTAARGAIEWEALALFAIVLLWQFPHFFSIAWLYAEDYAQGGIRMLPVVEKDGRSTTREILLYSLALIPVSFAPAVLGMAGPGYIIGALLLGVAYFSFGMRLRRLHLAPWAAQSKPAARRLLQASVAYLPLLFALLMISAGHRF